MGVVLFWAPQKMGREDSHSREGRELGCPGVDGDGGFAIDDWVEAVVGCLVEESRGGVVAAVER